MTPSEKAMKEFWKIAQQEAIRIVKERKQKEVIANG